MQNPQTFRRTLLLAAAGIVVVGALNPLRAQAPATDTKPPPFEVASVKPNKSGDDRRRRLLARPGGRLSVTNLPLRALIRFAYDIQDFQLSGGPNWMNSEPYDIEAKAGDDSIKANRPVPVQLMLRALLADRFKFAAHNESRELPVYALTVARNDGKLGPQLRKSELDCDALIKSGRQMGPPEPGKAPPCGARQNPGPLVPPTEIPSDLSGPSIFTAVQEQLGLKLESTKGSTDVLVIDHVEQPTPN
jgi:hypothetical protein